MPFASAQETNAEFFEKGRASKVVQPAAPPAEIKIVSYNIRYRAGEDLKRLIKLLRDDADLGRAVVIGLQEVDRHKKRTGGTNTARLLAEALQMNYAWAAPAPPPLKAKEQRDPSEEETGVEILSPYPLADVVRIILPNAGPGGRRRAAIGATVKIGETILRVYSVHAETRIAIPRKLEQYKAVIEDLKRYRQIEHAVILGDFNTWEEEAVSEVSKLFTAEGFQTPFSNTEPTWKTFILKLKLDWMWLKNLGATAYGIDREVNLSDHWPLWAIVKPQG